MVRTLGTESRKGWHPARLPKATDPRSYGHHSAAHGPSPDSERDCCQQLALRLPHTCGLSSPFPLCWAGDGVIVLVAVLVA